MFEKEKSVALSKIDKSHKGSIDENILDLVNKINTHPDYYTTSSCAGRIVVYTPGKKKEKFAWHYVSHHVVDVGKINQIISSCIDTIWLKTEGFILHICAKDVDAANVLLKIARENGLKRSGIISINDKVMIEIIAPERLDCPLVVNGKRLIDENATSILIDASNTKLTDTHKRINHLSISIASPNE